MVVSILQTIEIKLKEVENVVSCYRPEYDEAQRMKRHFMESDMALYFPKNLSVPVVSESFIDGKPVKITRREQPWIMEYWRRKYLDASQRGIPVRMLSADAMISQNAAIREKKQG